jgi:hypothetical protein
MGWAVILLPDERGDASAQRVWRAVRGAGFPSMLFEGDNRPHISLSVLETQDGSLDAAVRRFAAETQPVTVMLGSVGYFGETVIYLSPEPASSLLAMNRSLTAHLGPLSALADGHYLPGQWQPHLTVAFKIPEGGFNRALHVVRNNFVPFTTTFASVAVVKFNPVKIVNVYMLGVTEP